MFKFAVISFPGTNCENEAVRAFRRNGMEAEIVLWNDPGMLDKSRLDEFSGYCIAGGFSYEDRGRSGVVAAQDPITEVLKEEADKGKIILGICNGAQILVETGLVPGFDDKALGMALTWNEMKMGDKIIDTGFYCSWANLKNVASKKRSAFNDFEELLCIPFAHGEGRFMIEPELLEVLEKNEQIVFKYCDDQGQVDAHYPITPNGAVASIGAVCNPAGNVMAMMPHPERDPLGGNGNLIFQSIKKHLESKPNLPYKSLGVGGQKKNMGIKKNYDLEFYIRLIITDNTERTLEEALIRKGLGVKLDRYEFYGVNLASEIEPKVAVQRILESGELANFNKHLVYVKIGDGFFQYSAQKLEPKKPLFQQILIAAEEKDFVGQAKKTAINSHTGEIIQEVHYGILWNLIADAQTIEKVIDSKILYNPYSMILYRD